MVHLNRWPEIRAFHNVHHHVNKEYLQIYKHPVKYRSKPKVHGTNAAVQLRPDNRDRVICQSREYIIHPDDDNNGFATWVHNNLDYFKRWSHIINKPLTIYGEWAGPDIFPGTVAHDLPRMKFFPFAALRGDIDDPEAMLLTDPNYLNTFGHPDIHPVGWTSVELEVDFYDEISVEGFMGYINSAIAEVEKEDPWFKDEFGLSGPGEGLVFYPVSYLKKPGKFQSTIQWMFKAKGKQHKLRKYGNAVEKLPHIVASAEVFADTFLTAPRMEQAIRATNRGIYRFDTHMMGPFIGWIMNDIKKECSLEMSASGLTWREISPIISDMAKKWFLEQIANEHRLDFR